MMKVQQQQTQRGFTIVELIITVGILAVLSAFAMPTMVKTMRKTELNREVRSVVEAVQHARSEAVIQKRKQSASWSAIDLDKVAMSPEKPDVNYDFMGRLRGKDNKSVECLNIVVRHKDDPNVVASIEVRGFGNLEILKLEQNQCRDKR